MDKVTADWITEFNAMIAGLEGPEKSVDLSSGLLQRPSLDSGFVEKAGSSGQLSSGLIGKRHSNELINRILHRYEKLTSK